MKDEQPSWRKPAGIGMMMLFLLLWSVLVVSLSGWMTTLPAALQMVYYLVAGVAWIVPMRPLLIWMETGRWRA